MPFTASVYVPLTYQCICTDHLVGHCLRNPAEQRGSLKFLQQVEKKLGWRTAWMAQELEREWAELQELDSWDI